MDDVYVINYMDPSETMLYLSRVSLARENNAQREVMEFTADYRDALRFDSEEEALSVIDFICNDISYEHSEQMQTESIPKVWMDKESVVCMKKKRKYQACNDCVAACCATCIDGSNFWLSS